MYFLAVMHFPLESGINKDKNVQYGTFGKKKAMFNYVHPRDYFPSHSQFHGLTLRRRPQAAACLTTGPRVAASCEKPSGGTGPARFLEGEDEVGKKEEKLLALCTFLVHLVGSSRSFFLFLFWSCDASAVRQSIASNYGYNALN